MAEQPTQKPPLEREALRDVIDLSLWAGQLLLQHGAESARIEETVHRLGTGLGADWMDILVSPNAIVATTISGQEFRTKIRRIVAIGVNMQIIAEVNELSRKVTEGKLDRFQVREEIERIDHLPKQYNRWVVVAMVGLACAAFSRMLGGDWPVFFVTLVAASVAMWVRQELNRLYFNSLLVVVGTAFVAGVIASTAIIMKWGAQSQTALAASVLLLVPGVPLINCADDFIKGHLVVGTVRGITGGLVSLGIALGLLLAIRLMGVSGL
ncbi:MAG: threonine/serine exporter family protein [Chloroflexota bacterium]